MGKNQGFLSVNLSEARDNSAWAVSWLTELTVTSLPSPSFPLLSHVCPSQKPPCVDSKRPRVYRHHAQDKRREDREEKREDKKREEARQDEEERQDDEKMKGRMKEKMKRREKKEKMIFFVEKMFQDPQTRQMN